MIDNFFFVLKSLKLSFQLMFVRCVIVWLNVLTIIVFASVATLETEIIVKVSAAWKKLSSHVVNWQGVFGSAVARAWVSLFLSWQCILHILCSLFYIGKYLKLKQTRKHFEMENGGGEKNSWGDPVSSFHFIKWNQNGFIFNYVYYPSNIAQKPRFTPLWNFPVTNKIVDSSKWFDR